MVFSHGLFCEFLEEEPVNGLERVEWCFVQIDLPACFVGCEVWLWLAASPQPPFC